MVSDKLRRIIDRLVAVDDELLELLGESDYAEYSDAATLDLDLARSRLSEVIGNLEEMQE